MRDPRTGAIALRRVRPGGRAAAVVAFAAVLTVLVVAAMPSRALAQTGAPADAGTGVTAPAQILAIVEEIEPSPEDAAARDRPLVTQVRAAFVRDAAGWSPFCPPAEAGGDRPVCAADALGAGREWAVVRAGRRVGGVTTGDWYDTRRVRTLGVLRLASPAPAAERSSAFAAADDVPLRRPLVALARAREGVPGGWREAAVRPADVAASVALFTPAMPKLPGCAPDAPTATALAPAHFRPIGGLVSAGGERVWGVRLDPALRKACPGAPGVEWSDFWLYAKGAEAPQLLSLGPMVEAAMRSTLVDIGDWDGDGKVDALFWHAVPGEDGYVLVWGGFENLVRAMRTYH